MMTARQELRGLAERLRPDLAQEIARLYNLEHRHQQERQLLEETHRRLHAATVTVGDLRQRLHAAEGRLAELGVDEILKARRAAVFLGEGYVRLISQGGGRFHTVHVPTERVTIRDQ